jgi:hypothetical protein
MDISSPLLNKLRSNKNYKATDLTIQVKKRKELNEFHKIVEQICSIESTKNLKDEEKIDDNIFASFEFDVDGHELLPHESNKCDNFIYNFNSLILDDK